MKTALALGSAALLLLVAAAPATRPTTAPAPDRFIVQVRHVEYAANAYGASGAVKSAMDIPADATEVTSLQVLAEPGAPFETVAVINGTRYSLSGKLKTTPPCDGEDYVRLEFDYRETGVKDPGSIMQVRSNVLVKPGESVHIGGMHRDPIVTGLILTVKQPDASPQQ